MGDLVAGGDRRCAACGARPSWSQRPLARHAGAPNAASRRFPCTVVKKTRSWWRVFGVGAVRERLRCNQSQRYVRPSRTLGEVRRRRDSNVTRCRRGWPPGKPIAKQRPLGTRTPQPTVTGVIIWTGWPSGSDMIASGHRQARQARRNLARPAGLPDPAGQFAHWRIRSANDHCSPAGINLTHF